MSGRVRHRISHPFHSVPPGRFHTSSSRTPSPSTSTSPPRGRVNSHLQQSQTYDSISAALGSAQRPRPRQRRASNMPGLSSSLAPHRIGDNADGREPIHKEINSTRFEWSIYDLKHLVRHVHVCQPSIWALANEQEQPESLPEVLKRGVLVGDGWYKLEIARALTNGHSPYSTLDQIAEESRSEMPEIKALTLYVSALYLENQALDVNYSADIRVGIRPIIKDIGNKHAGTTWLWNHHGSYEFSRDREFYEIALPDFKTFLTEEAISQADALSLCIEITSSPIVKPSFTWSNTVLMPSDMVKGLGAMLDSTGGDVKFVCLEHAAENDLGYHVKRGMSRKRLVYAHSEILKARSEYFRDLLDGGFSESEARRADSKYTTILVDDASYDTVYWLLRFIYTNQLDFAAVDDVRGLMDMLSINRAEINSVLSSVPAHNGPGEWEYQRLLYDNDNESLCDILDQAEIEVKSPVGASTGRHQETRGRERAGSVSASTTASAASTAASSRSSATKALSTTSARTSSSTTATPAQGSNITSPKRPLTSSTTRPAVSVSKPSKSISPQKLQSSSTSSANRQTYPSRLQPEADPHAHPCAKPKAASALSVYMLAHRYRLTELEAMAKEHVLASLKSDNCMPVLFASYPYSTLHEDVLDYIVDCWGSVRQDQEFFKCIQEVSSGVWGETGGLVLHGLFSKL